MTIKRGEVYKVNMDPTTGSEIRKQRPAVIISADSINKVGSVVVVCPITDAFLKSSPIHIEIPEGEGGLTKDSVAHCGQIRAVDAQRLGNKLGDLERQTMAKVSMGIRNALDLW